MGLMSNSNPYYGGNAFAEVINQGLEGWNRQEDRNMAMERQASDLANQAELRRIQGEQLAIQQAEAQRKQSAYDYQQKGQQAVQDLYSPVPDAARQDYINKGLLEQGPPDMAQYPLEGYLVTPQVSPDKLFQTALPYMDTKEIGNTYKEMGLASKPDQITQKDMLTALATGKVMPESLQAARRPDGTMDWSKVQIFDNTKEPGYKQREYEKGDKKYFEESQDGGRTWKPVSDAPRYKPVSGGDSNPVAQSTFVDPKTGMPLVFDKKAGTYRVASIQGGGGVTGKPTALSPEAATKVEMLDTTIRLVPEIRKQMFDAKGNIDWLDVANAQTKTWGTKGRKIATDINQAVEQVLRVESGAAVPEQEVVRAAARFKPQIGDTKEIVLSKMNNLEKFVQGARDKFNVGRSPQAQGNEVIQRVPPKTMTSLPPASEHAGRTVIGSDGIKRKSNGSKWELVR